jgi:two-component system, chemotaxis family, CheB/CheR fusion protein
MEPSDRSFPIVGIGASAGGLEAVSELLAELPATSGMAFLLVQHLDPRHQSFLTEILKKKTEIGVETAADGTVITPNHLYVIPPNATMTVADGALRLTPRESTEHPHRPINILFRSLAEQHVHRAVAVVLSGTDSDGAQGLEEVKAAGGITMAQEPTTAKFDGMPKNAIATGCVDFILTPKKLGQEMVRIGNHPYLNSDATPAELPQERDGLSRIFRLLQGKNGTDFSRYKRSTVQRRLARRMALRQIDGLVEYAELLKHEPEEVQALAQDFLIRVTGFFRDPETFAGLSETVLPALLENRSPKEPLRIWVPGCASGEEAYSIAMVLMEYLGDRASSVRVQIFGTDLSDAAIQKARTGFYTDTIGDEVSPERLQRFFVKLDDHYQVSKTIRDLCVFARHDVTRDPPFSRLGLVSCRNLLIYLDQTLQRQIIPLFHYALNPGGFLVLGPSETIGASSELFRLVDGRHQIYRKQPVPARVLPAFSMVEAAVRPGAAEIVAAVNPALVESERAQDETERLLLARYAPAAILIDDSFNVVYFHGETSRYLEHSRGPASLNLQKICRAGLLVELSPAIHEAQKTERAVRREGVRVELPGDEREVSFEVVPTKLPGIESRYFLILFGPPSSAQPFEASTGLFVRLWASLFGVGAHVETEKDNEIVRLRRELDATRDYLQATVEEHEAAKEEMKSAHEEALSANEEFLSTNEELETAKEELQSANEELGVTNQELRDRNRELNELNQELQRSRNSLNAIVETLREPLLVLDGELRVQKANREFYETFHMRPEETLGRHLYDLGNGEWNIPALRKLLERILPDVSSLRDFEVTHDFSSIGEKTMLLNARQLAHGEHRDGMILLAIEDITERQLSRKNLVEADERKNKFLATLAHELRNPLTPIRLGIELLRTDAKEVGLRQLDMMERQVDKLIRLVDDLLDIARIERDHVELRKKPVDLAGVVNSAIEASRHYIDDRHHHLTLSLPAQPVWVMADPMRLEQVVSNLLSNASKYTDACGEIAVNVERAGEDAVLTVRDNGIGIQPELLPQLFEMFFQVDASLDRTGGGLGIGLSVTKRLVELHGGRVEGKSDGLGTGSRFTVNLPTIRDRDHQDDSHNGELQEPPAAGSVTHRVLIVDDNPDTTDTTTEIAKSWGHDVAVANSGPAALDLAGQMHPDIILIDIGLPEMNGYELARRLRQLPGMETTRLIAVTGYGREEDRQAAHEAGFNLHLTKPVDPSRLKRLLATLE